MTDLTVTQTLAIGLPIAFFIIFLEAVLSSWQKKSYYKTSDTLCTLGLLVGNMVVVLATKGLTLAFHIYLYQFRVFDIASMVPLWVMWLLAFILIDLVFYIYHRLSHRVSFFVGYPYEPSFKPRNEFCCFFQTSLVWANF